MGESPPYSTLSKKSQKRLCNWRNTERDDRGLYKLLFGFLYSTTRSSNFKSWGKNWALLETSFFSPHHSPPNPLFPSFLFQIKLSEIFKILATASGVSSTTSARTHLDFFLRTQLESSVSTAAVATFPKVLPIFHQNHISNSSNFEDDMPGEDS